MSYQHTYKIGKRACGTSEDAYYYEFATFKSYEFKPHFLKRKSYVQTGLVLGRI